MLSEDDVLRRLNLSPLTIELLVEEGMILSLYSPEGNVYPEEQFSDTGINARFASLMGLFRRLDLDAGEIWWWLNEKLDVLNGLSRLEALSEATTDDAMARLRFAATSYWEIETLVGDSQERTDWLRYSADVDPYGIGDYTPKRRGGQHAS